MKMEMTLEIWNKRPHQITKQFTQVNFTPSVHHLEKHILLVSGGGKDDNSMFIDDAADAQISLTIH